MVERLLAAVQATFDDVDYLPSAAESFFGRDAEGLEFLPLRAHADPKSKRPLETMSTAAISSASLSGLWNGAQMTDVPTRMRSVRAATCANIISGDEFPEAKQKWCSPK
jgi:hypothetical protein